MANSSAAKSFDTLLYLGDVTIAGTILDRLMHRCAMLEFEGKGCRREEAAARIAITPGRHDPRVLPGGIWGGHGWGNLTWPSGQSRQPRSTMIGTLPMTPMRMTAAELTGERRLLGPAV